MAKRKKVTDEAGAGTPQKKSKLSAARSKRKRKPAEEDSTGENAKKHCRVDGSPASNTLVQLTEEYGDEGGQLVLEDRDALRMPAVWTEETSGDSIRMESTQRGESNYVPVRTIESSNRNEPNASLFVSALTVDLLQTGGPPLKENEHQPVHPLAYLEDESEDSQYQENESRQTGIFEGSISCELLENFTFLNALFIALFILYAWSMNRLALESRLGGQTNFSHPNSMVSLHSAYRAKIEEVTGAAIQYVQESDNSHKLFASRLDQLSRLLDSHENRQPPTKEMKAFLSIFGVEGIDEITSETISNWYNYQLEISTKGTSESDQPVHSRNTLSFSEVTKELEKSDEQLSLLGDSMENLESIVQSVDTNRQTILESTSMVQQSLDELKNQLSKREHMRQALKEEVQAHTGKIGLSRVLEILNKFIDTKLERIQADTIGIRDITQPSINLLIVREEKMTSPSFHPLCEDYFKDSQFSLVQTLCSYESQAPDAEVVFQPTHFARRCWTFHGQEGNLTAIFRGQGQKIRGFAMEFHRELLETIFDIRSVPTQVDLVGLNLQDTPMETVLGSLQYDVTGPSIQTRLFSKQFGPFQGFKLRFRENGGASYSCVHRVRVF